MPAVTQALDHPQHGGEVEAKHTAIIGDAHLRHAALNDVPCLMPFQRLQGMDKILAALAIAVLPAAGAGQIVYAAFPAVRASAAEMPFAAGAETFPSITIRVNCVT